MKLNCLIIDDEPMARKGLEEYIREIEFLNCIALCENALKATAYLNTEKIDLLYLDINMPKISGLDFLKTLKNPPLTILTTAFTEHALEGYSLDVIDYLVKPITFDRFLKASQKAFEFYQMKSKNATGVDYFFVKSDRKFEKVYFRDVLYIEGMQNYALIHTNDKKLITYVTLAGIESQLPPDSFLKIHKSFIINIARVNAIEGDEIIIQDSRLPIGRSVREQVVQRILGNNLLKR